MHFSKMKTFKGFHDEILKLNLENFLLYIYSFKGNKMIPRFKPCNLLNFFLQHLRFSCMAFPHFSFYLLCRKVSIFIVLLFEFIVFYHKRMKLRRRNKLKNVSNSCIDNLSYWKS